ncbi:MAG: DUF3347 domain-containing protein [Fibrobacterota bacterium]|nr:DUF3347 domain-containing protein [Fibrobacterota bacterium]
MRRILAAIAGSALLFSACKDKASAAPDGKQKAASLSIPEPVLSVPDTFKAALGKVLEGYSQIQGALAQDDFAKAKEAFSSMHAVLHMMPKDGLEPAAKAYWDSTDTRIMSILHPMASAETLEATRTYFMDFTLVLVDVIEKLGVGGEGPVYQFRCPMARENKGADWLQGDSILANPYYGKSMPKCGEFIRKLKS